MTDALTITNEARRLQQTIEALGRSEERFRLLTELSSDWYWEQDAQGRFVQVSGSDSAAHGGAAAGYLGNRLWEIAGVQAPMTGWEVHWAVLHAGLPFHNLELRMADRGGRPVWIAISGIPVVDAAGQRTGYRGVGRDISVDKQAAITRQEDFDRLLKITSHVPGMVYQCRMQLDGSIDYPFMSEGIRALTGLGPQDVRNDIVAYTALVHPDDLDRLRATTRASARDLTPWQQEYRIRSTDGAQRWLLGSSVPEREPDGSTLWSGVTTDITQRKLEQVQLGAALQEKSALLQEVHHRVKNNLQVIVSLLRLESRRGETAAIKTVLDDMQGRIRSMALLHESLYRTGVFATTDLAIYLRELATQAFRALASNERPVRLELDLAPVRVGLNQGTPLGLITNELITNCFKHGLVPGRIGTLRVALQRVPDSALVRLQVSDDGAGFPVDHTHRAQQSLGLQLVGDLAEQLDATLDFGPGSLVTMTFTPDPMPAALDEGA